MATNILAALDALNEAIYEAHYFAETTFALTGGADDTPSWVPLVELQTRRIVRAAEALEIFVRRAHTGEHSA